MRLADAVSPRGTSPVVFGGDAEETPVFDGERLSAGARIEGPAVVEDRHTTTLLWPGDRLTVDDLGGYRVELA